MKIHGNLAQETGVPETNVFVCQNGEIIQGREKSNDYTEFFINRNGEKMINADPNYVLNQKIIRGEWWKKYVDLRHKMFLNGVVMIIFLIKKKKSSLVAVELPHIFTYGFINMEKNKTSVQNWKKSLADLVVGKEDKKITELKEEIKNKMQDILLHDLPKTQPLIIPLLEYIE